MAHLWEPEHDYYCSETNYYSNDTVQEYGTLIEFLAAEGDSDMDYNLVFRWDWQLIEEDAVGRSVSMPEGDDYYRGYDFKVFWMGQRKGLYRSTITKVCRADEPAVIEWLRPRWDHLSKLWAPISESTAPVRAGST